MVSTETDYARHGIAMHKLAAICLGNYLEAWEGLQQITNVELVPDEVQAVQAFIDHCRRRREILKDKYGTVTAYVELPIYRPELHELYYGQLDYALHAGDYAEIWDFKGGAGISVEAIGNAQTRMYGAGFVVGDLDQIRNIRLGVFQPRGWHPDGPARQEDLEVSDLMHWVDTVLLPGMERTENSDELVPGEHCRFCPAKRGCPALQQQLEILEQHELMPDISDEALGHVFQLIPTVKMKIAAIEAEVLRRNLATPNNPVPYSKVVQKIAHRLWKEGARNVFHARYGNDALEPATLKTPRQMEDLPNAKDLVKAWSWTPDNGYTTAQLSDKRKPVFLASPSSRYPLLDNAPEE